MKLRAEFQCMNGCSGRYPLSQVIYRCPKCHSLLEVRHDMSALAETPGPAWKRLFQDRWMTTVWPYGSGVWGKKEWVCPGIPDDAVVSMAEGGTNLFWAERYGAKIGVRDLWIKQCGNSHTGSFKDLGMTVLVSVVRQMIRDGAPIRAIACASTGDTSAALSAYCAAAGIRAVVLLPRGKVSTAQLVQPLSNGAQVLALDTDFDGCMEHVQKLAQEPGVYLANSMNSLRLEGQKTVAVEIIQQFDWEVPDWIVIPGGNLGNVAALGAGLRMMKTLGLISRSPRICVAQAANAAPLYHAYQSGFENFKSVTAGDTQASAIRIGNPVSVERAIRVLRDFGGVVEAATESELSEASARADRAGAYTCPHTGVALAAVEKLARNGSILPDERVVVVSTANGLKFTGFKTGYHESALPEVSSQAPNRPIELSHDYAAIRRTVLGELDA